MTVRDSQRPSESDSPSSPDSNDEGELELTALARLGLAVQVPSDDPGPRGGEGTLDWLVRLGRIKPHQALAVKGMIQRGSVACACGQRSLAPDSGEAFRCTGCGAALVKQSTGGWTAKKARKVPGVGDRIGPLELLAVLGKGAYGTVYRAKHQVGRLSAVKVLGSSALDPRTKKRFEREVEALARLRHPGIVSVHSAFEHEGTLVCEMDLVQGEDLEARVKRVGPLPWKEAVRLCRVIANAVEHAHEQGVVHRDLKPANILIRESDGAPLVADFGLARLADQESSLTRVGAYVGTPVYMAPECFAGQHGPQSDVYAIGGMLSFLVTGRDPFDEPTPHALLAKIASGASPPIDVPGVPEGLERIRARAMLVDRTRRYKAAAHLAEDLGRLLAGESIEGEPILRPRTKAALGVGLAVLAVALGAGIAKVTRKPKPGPSATPTPTFATADDALEALARGERDVAVRAAANKTLGISGRSLGLAAIDSAVLRAPDDPDLRRLRAGLARRSGSALDPLDVASVASSSEATVVESVAIDALAAGLKGGLAAAAPCLDGARQRQPGSRSLATLWALAACAAGDPSRRGAVADALAATRPTDERARRLHRALGHADTFATALLNRDASHADSLQKSILQEMLPLVAELPGTVPFVLAPVGPAARRAWSLGYLRDLTHTELEEALVGLLKPLLDHLTPLLRAVLAVQYDLDPRLRDAPDYALVCGRDPLLAAANALIDEDPAIGSAILELAVSTKVVRLDRESAPEILAEIDRATAACARALRLPENQEGPGRLWQSTVARRCAGSRLELEEMLASLTRDPEEARAHHETALEYGRRQVAIDEEDMPSLAERDQGRLVKILWGLGRVEEAVNAYSEGAGRDAMRAEACRESGDVAGALKLARSVAARSLPGVSRVDALAVVTLCLAQQGDLEAAEKAFVDLAAAEKGSGSTLEVLDKGSVRTFLDSKKPR